MSQKLESADRNILNPALPEEHSLGGKLLAEARDLVFGKAASKEENERRIEQNEGLSSTLANMAALVPTRSRFLGAGIRTALLANPDELKSDPGKFLMDSGKHFFEGMVLNTLSRVLASKMSSEIDNRAIQRSLNVNLDGTASRTPLSWGVTNRQIAENELLSLNEGVSSSLNYYRIRADGSVRSLTQSRFLKEVAVEARRADGLIGYIPGIRQSPAEAARDAIAVSNGSKLPVITLDWASTNKSEEGVLSIVSQIKKDVDASTASQGWINDSAKTLFEGFSGRKILVGHSHGAKLAFETTRRLAQQEIYFDGVALAHPHDISVDNLNLLSSLTKRVTLVTDPFDRALRAERGFLGKLFFDNLRAPQVDIQALASMNVQRLNFISRPAQGWLRHTPDFYQLGTALH